MKHGMICTQFDPWKPSDPDGKHPDAREVHDGQRDGWPGGDLVTYECPHCKRRFEIELAQ